MVCIGIIGGSGLDDPKLLQDAKELTVTTAYGSPSSALLTGTLLGVSVVILARHGRHHEIPPSQVNFRANIQSLVDQGVTHILATTAVGSLRESIRPGDLVFPDQVIDFTKKRAMSFYEKKVVHTPMADPFDASLRELLVLKAEELQFSFHKKGTLITIEGPRFSTKAESSLFRLWNADIINMSTCPEVFLANELGIPYQAIAMSTDYDCWKEDEEPVSFPIILQRMKENADKVKNLLLAVVGAMKL
ncbi:MAG: S-methyl-5'-thioadenosine phosphorylase [Candidatus Woesearchaeota archaeon]|nr:MAG: S-methyl-5'-thioadenosine phosphorylase [Candidatus Woesearchaeota archaeon]